jgi:hypothetical protein
MEVLVASINPEKNLLGEIIFILARYISILWQKPNLFDFNFPTGMALSLEF